MASCIYDSPVGQLHIVSDSEKIVEVSFILCAEKKISLLRDLRLLPTENNEEILEDVLGREYIDENTIIYHNLPGHQTCPQISRDSKEVCGVLQSCLSELDLYFAGKLKNFTVPIKLTGTDFRMRCWEALRTIPYGETISYGQLAKKVGNPKASRAVGGANHHNPIAVIVPCHRVIGADGSLTGFGGGLYKKEFLLELERTNK